MIDINLQTFAKKSALIALIAVSVLVGAAGGILLKATQTSAQTPAASAAPNTGGTIDNAVPTGSFKSNEDPAHEAKESPEREAQENAGQRPTVK